MAVENAVTEVSLGRMVAQEWRAQELWMVKPRLPLSFFSTPYEFYGVNTTTLDKHSNGFSSFSE